MTYHLGADYFEDPHGTFVSQPKKYIDKLADTYKRLFNEDTPKGYKTPLDKNNRKISMIFPLVSCCSCVNDPSSS